MAQHSMQDELVQTLSQELAALRSELQELRQAKDEALAELSRCCAKLEHVELRSSSDELSAPKQRQQPKEENASEVERYA